MQHVSGTAVGSTGSDLKLRKPRSATTAAKAAEKGKLVSTAKRNQRAAPAGEQNTTKTSKKAASASKKGTIRKSGALTGKQDASAAPKKDIRRTAAAEKGKVIAKPAEHRKKGKTVAQEQEIARHEVAHAKEQRFIPAERSADSGVAARVAEARKNLPESSKREFRFSIVARIREFCKKVFGSS